MDLHARSVPVFPRTISSWLRLLALIMTAVAAMFGVPLIIDPPPRDHSAECQDAEGQKAGGKKRRRRAS
jgi:hypothetical protein